MSQFASMHFAKYERNLMLCAKFKLIVQKASLMTRCEGGAQHIEQDYMKKRKAGQHVKEMDFALSMPQGWLSMSTEIDETAAMSLRMISMQTYLQKLYLHFSGYFSKL